LLLVLSREAASWERRRLAGWRDQKPLCGQKNQGSGERSSVSEICRSLRSSAGETPNVIYFFEFLAALAAHDFSPVF